jgi:hypothetical protein
VNTLWLIEGGVLFDSLFATSEMDRPDENQRLQTTVTATLASIVKRICHVIFFRLDFCQTVAEPGNTRAKKTARLGKTRRSSETEFGVVEQGSRWRQS